VVLGGGADGNGGGEAPLLVLLHGFGATGQDLVPLGQELGGPALRFACPAAPLALEPGPADRVGRAWWLIDMLELQRAVMFRDFDTLMNRAPAGLTEARTAVTELLTELEREHGMVRSKLVLGGFSQGAMLATDVTLHLEQPPAALAIFSGSLINRQEWLPRMKARAGLPVLQSHGDADPVLSFEIAEKLRDELTSAGLDVEFIRFKGGHGIPAAPVMALDRLVKRVTT